MKYYLKRLGHQELGSVKNGKAQRGRYIYISKDENVLDMFPPLSKTVTNDSSIIPIIPLYQEVAKKYIAILSIITINIMYLGEQEMNTGFILIVHLKKINCCFNQMIF